MPFIIHIAALIFFVLIIDGYAAHNLNHICHRTSAPWPRVLREHIARVAYILYEKKAAVSGLGANPRKICAVKAEAPWLAWSSPKVGGQNPTETGGAPVLYKAGGTALGVPRGGSVA